MRSLDHDEKTAKLCAGFSLLDEKDQEYFLGILQTLLFAKEKAEEAAGDVPPARDSLTKCTD